MRPSFLPTTLFVMLALIGAPMSRAQFVTPTGYTYGVAPSTTGPSGPTNIYPDSGGELTDGILGLNFDHYVTEIDAAAWTGWANVSPSISFQFATTQTFTRIEIGTTRSDGRGIGALASVTVAGSTFTSGIVIGDVTRDWLVFDQSFSTTLVGGIPTITLSLTTTALPSQWIMLDEVRFTAVPEPADAAVAISLVAVALSVRARRRVSDPPPVR